MLDESHNKQRIETRIAYLIRRINTLEQSIEVEAKLRDKFDEERIKLEAELKAIRDG